MLAAASVVAGDADSAAATERMAAKSAAATNLPDGVWYFPSSEPR
jgi:hypothetical protein